MCGPRGRLKVRRNRVLKSDEKGKENAHPAARAPQGARSRLRKNAHSVAGISEKAENPGHEGTGSAGLDDFVGKPCKSRVAFEFIPKQRQAIDLTAAAEKLRSKEVFVEVDTPFIVMLKLGGRNVSLFKSGKILVKQTADEREARVIAARLAEMLR